MFYTPEHLERSIIDILPSLKRLQRQGGSSAEEIVLAINSGNARLFLCDTGYIVAYITEENGDRVFFVWAAEASGNAFETYMPYIEAMASALECRYVGFNTTRKGFSRKLKNTGFKPVSVEYRKEINV